MVVSEAVKSFKFDNVVYIALFTDPQLYLPEGKGLFPVACSGNNFSSYRIYVPVCRTNEGRLKARNPYVYGELEGKYGLWCGTHDYVCGSTNYPWDISGHTKYVDKIPQLASILKKRLLNGIRVSSSNITKARRTSFSNAINAASIEDGIFANLLMDEYYVKPNMELVIDASYSYSLDSELVEYLWSFDGGDFWSSGRKTTISRSFENEGEHVVRVRVVDELGVVDEAESKIFVTNKITDDSLLPAPSKVKAFVVDGDVRIEWSDIIDDAKYFYLRFNDCDLGFAMADQRSLMITDIESLDDVKISVAWADESFGLGKFIDLEISSAETESYDEVAEEELDCVTNDTTIPEESDALSQPVETPNTGVSLSDGIMPCFVILFCVLVIWKILHK